MKNVVNNLLHLVEPRLGCLFSQLGCKVLSLVNQIVTYQVGFYEATNNVAVKAMTVAYAVAFQAEWQLLLYKSNVLIDFCLFPILPCLGPHHALKRSMPQRLQSLLFCGRELESGRLCCLFQIIRSGTLDVTNFIQVYSRQFEPGNIFRRTQNRLRYFGHLIVRTIGE